jgi:beta-mannosidase
VASWASIDYYGRWKALHYYAKRFFAPVTISCAEESPLLSISNVNAESRVNPALKSKTYIFRLSVCNETAERRQFDVEWSLRSADSTSGDGSGGGIVSVTVAPYSAAFLYEVTVNGMDPYSDYVSYQLLDYDGDTVIASGTTLFAPPKHFRFSDPHLAARIDPATGEIVVTASCYAKGVEIRNENEDLILSDNYFDMDAGEKRIKIISGDAASLRLRSVFDIK